MRFWKMLLVMMMVPVTALMVTGCFGDDDDPVDPDEDTTPPAAVDDLIAYDATLNTITLSWTAPGDDGDEGTATTYDIRYSTDGPRFDWATATPLSGEPSPGAPGSQEVWVVENLDEATEYSFALKTADEVPNWSDMSNTAVDTTLGSLMVATGYNPNYALVHSETGEDVAYVNHGLTGTVSTALGFQGHKVFILADGDNSSYKAIHICDALTGEGLAQLTDDLAMSVSDMDGNPVAPVVAFAASPTFNGWDNIYTISESGGTATPLVLIDDTFTLGRATVEILEANQPCWSPDGSKIAFRCAVKDVAHPYPRHDTICAVDANGSNITPIYWRQDIETATFRTPCWTADGNYVAFVEDNPTYDKGVVFVSMATGNAYNLWATFDINDYEPHSITMDPWLMRIAVYYQFPSGNNIWVADLNTVGDVITNSPPVQHTDNLDAGHHYVLPDWAPWSPIW